jgi:hypothetical protein
MTPEPPFVPEPPAGLPAISGPGDRPGDAACWLHLVCPGCGTMAEAQPPTDCPQCGTRIDPGR